MKGKKSDGFTTGASIFYSAAKAGSQSKYAGVASSLGAKAAAKACQNETVQKHASNAVQKSVEQSMEKKGFDKGTASWFSQQSAKATPGLMSQANESNIKGFSNSGFQAFNDFQPTIIKPSKSQSLEGLIGFQNASNNSTSNPSINKVPILGFQSQSKQSGSVPVFPHTFDSNEPRKDNVDDIKKKLSSLYTSSYTPVYLPSQQTSSFLPEQPASFHGISSNYNAPASKTQSSFQDISSSFNAPAGKSQPFAAFNDSGFADSFSSTANSESFAIATYNYNATASDELSFQANDRIVITGKINDDWLLGKCSGKSGIFPVTFVDVKVPFVEEAILPTGITKFKDHFSDVPHCVALYDYSATCSDDISFTTGDQIRLLSKVDGDWFKGETTNGETGLFPANFVEVIKPLPNIDFLATGKALFKYDASAPDDVSVNEGDAVGVTEWVDENWCKIMNMNTNFRGLIPISFIDCKPPQKADAPKLKFPFNVSSIYDYAGANYDELSFKSGCRIKVTGYLPNTTDWYVGELNGKSGCFPSNFVR